jgi:probable addiction module antidote protein
VDTIGGPFEYLASVVGFRCLAVQAVGPKSESQNTGPHCQGEKNGWRVQETEAAMKKKTIYKPFDAAAYLDNDAVIAEYLSAAAEDRNPEVFLAALGDVAKARGIAQIAKESGLGRESLYKTLSAGAHPRFETINSVLHALGVKFTVVAERES